jgi:hypothetical protein
MPSQISYITINARVVEVVQVQDWSILAIKKETAGIVTFGTDVNVAPGRGMTGSADLMYTILVSPGTTIYAYAANQQAVSYIVTPIGEILAMLLKGGLAPGQKLNLFCKDK